MGGQNIWTEEDRAKALQFQAKENQRCRSCGTFPEDWLDEEGRLVEPLPYTLETHTCVGCELLEEENERREKAKRKSTGIKMWFRRRRQGDRQPDQYQPFG